MIPFRANKLTVTVILIFFIGVLGYAYFEARNVIRGPQIALAATLEDELVVDKPLVLVRGMATNITELRMNSRAIPTTEAGAFEEAHLLAPGYNTIRLEARDKIGRTTQKNIEVVYKPTVEISTTTSTTTEPNL